MNCPSDNYNPIRWLPNTKHFDPYGFKEHSSMKSQSPENEPVFVNARKSVSRVSESYIIPVDAVTKVLVKEERGLLSEGADGRAHVRIEIIAFQAFLILWNTMR